MNWYKNDYFAGQKAMLSSAKYQFGKSSSNRTRIAIG
jgi:hypothetical protein